MTARGRASRTDGRTFDVHHPELLMVGRTGAELGVRSPDFAHPVYERVITISLLHIMQVERAPESDAG